MIRPARTLPVPGFAAGVLALAAWAAPGNGQESPELQTLQLAAWCTVTCPEAFYVGTVAEITVAYRGIAEKTQLCCDLHYTQTDGSAGGFYANDWRPKPEVQGDGDYTFTIPIGEREGLALDRRGRLSYRDPAGEWATHTRVAQSEAIPVADPNSGYDAWREQMRWNKSWIGFDWETLRGPLTEGDQIEVTVEYYLDPSEHLGKTTLRLEALGPRVPKPDAPQPVTFDNTQHLWYGEQPLDIQPGRGKHTFPLTIPQASEQNNLLLLAVFIDSRGNRWPWDVRASAWFVRKGGFFELGSEKPGNLFTYDEPVRLLARLKNVTNAGARKVLRYTVYDTSRAQVAQGEASFTVQENGQAIPIDLALARRGTFLLRAEVEGWEARETTFCRIPDVMALTGGKPTPFGMTVHEAPWLGFRTEEVLQVARRLGLTTCRAFTEWAYLEPGPGVYALNGWDSFFELAHQHGIETVITIYNPPAWVQPVGQYVGYRVFACDLDAFRDMVTTVSTRYRGRFWGWEWLNEITPGGTPNCAEDYATLCRVGTEAARAVDPSLRFGLAGGLWPRSYRLDVLNAGAGRYVDVLPIHYANGSGIAEARADLDAFGHPKVAVWENESAAPLITWGWPGLDALADTTQAAWVLTQWTDELAAGAQRLIYFGGEGDAIGDFDYLMADHSPRPVAATLAVFTAKLWDAQPVGTFRSSDGAALFHLFARKGEAVLVASAAEGAEVPLAVGAAAVRLTDDQGNETPLAAKAGVVALPLRPLPCFIEGASLEVLKAYVVPSIQVPSAGSGGGQVAARPQVTLLRGQSGAIPVYLRNPYRRRLEGLLRLHLPERWSASAELRFSLAPGESKLLPVPVTVPETADLSTASCQLTASFASRELPVVERPFAVSVLSREMVGNLLQNGGFEEVEADGVTPTGWHGVNAQAVSSEGLGLGLGERILKFANTPEWAYYGQQLNLPGGLTYLYTAWVWNQGMGGGSNISQVMQDGTQQELYDVNVFVIGDETPYWQVFTCRYKAPENLAAASFTPVVQGDGSALYDNMQVTVFEGTDFAAEAYQTARPVVVDGDLADWDLRCPIPLIGRNQLRLLDPDYQWTPANLNGVAYLAWDEQNLYVAVQVLDDIHHPAGDGDSVTEGDSLTLAFDPTDRGPDAAKQAFAYYVSSRAPGSGSGAHTLWRPAGFSGGRPAGHLARDSSVHELAVKPSESGCIYELRIPFSELGVSPAFGCKLGLAIQLNDNDRKGLAAQMNWGGGLSPAWSPGDFGVIRMVD